MFLKLRKTPILEFLRWAQNLRIWSFCVKYAEPPILEYQILLIIFLKLRKTSNFGVFAVGAKPPILEFLCKVRRTSDFGVLNIINNIFKTTQNLRFWSFCVMYAEPPILEY